MERFGSKRNRIADLRERGIAATVGRFRREEDGSLIIFGLYCFIIMLLMAGVALDLMRFEERRTTLQNTVDRAALAAADLNQRLVPDAVVRDYFAKAGLDPAKAQIAVSEDTVGNSWRTVQVTTSEVMPTWFMNMMGVPVLGVPAGGTAEERIGQVEISLVLDVSGSMNSSGRLTSLKKAAKEFVDQMFDTVEPGKLSISIVPYATQVSLGADLAQYFKMTDEHNYSHCIDFEQSDFEKTSLQLKSNSFLAGEFSLLTSARTYQQTGHFDPWYYTTTPGDSKTADVVSGNPTGLTLNGDGLWVCSTATNRQILPFSGDRNALKAKIDAFQADGNTSIDVGMRWGMALLDPTAGPIMDKMVADGQRPSVLGDRPYPLNGKVASKIIVVMTDGQNTNQYYLTPEYSSGWSPVWKNSEDGYYSVYNSYYNEYYVPNIGRWRSQAWGNGPGGWDCDSRGRNCYYERGAAEHLTLTKLWNDVSLSYVSDYLIKGAFGNSGRNEWRKADDYVVATGGKSWSDTKDNRLDAMCTTAKSKGVIIFSIGLEAPDHGLEVMKQCATTPGHFYPATSSSLDQAFSSIANSINKLRLTN